MPVSDVAAEAVPSQPLGKGITAQPSTEDEGDAAEAVSPKPSKRRRMVHQRPRALLNDAEQLSKISWSKESRPDEALETLIAEGQAFFDGVDERIKSWKDAGKTQCDTCGKPHSPPHRSFEDFGLQRMGRKLLELYKLEAKSKNPPSTPSDPEAAAAKAQKPKAKKEKKTRCDRCGDYHKGACNVSKCGQCGGYHRKTQPCVITTHKAALWSTLAGEIDNHHAAAALGRVFNQTWGPPSNERGNDKKRKAE